MNALILTNRFKEFSGSEIIALEVADFLKDCGFEVSIYTNMLGKPICNEIKKEQINMSDSDNVPNLLHFDIIWAQHHLLPMTISNIAKKPGRYDFPFIITAHLSPYEPFESAGFYCERKFSNIIAVNSKETETEMQSNGLEKHKLITFYNGAPQKFFLDSEEAPALKKILLISNHPPKEILHALKILNKKITVQIKIIGKGLDMYKRLTPKDFMWADAVITIGKSVQYAIASKKAIFCYDHFGGPGWITRKNYKRAEWYNYSGRCCGTKLTPEEIAFELETNFLFAQKEIRHIHNETKERYNFNSFLNKIISKHTQTTRNSFQLNDSDIALIRTETNFAKNLRRLYRENLQHKHSTISVKLLINKAWRKIQNICSEVKFFI